MFSALLSTVRMPCLGQCLNLGRGSKDKDADIVPLLGHAAVLDWHMACKL